MSANALALASAAPIKMLCPTDRLFNESKIVVKEFALNGVLNTCKLSLSKSL
jgi:hypothetical protein